MLGFILTNVAGRHWVGYKFPPPLLPPPSSQARSGQVIMTTYVDMFDSVLALPAEHGRGRVAGTAEIRNTPTSREIEKLIKSTKVMELSAGNHADQLQPFERFDDDDLVSLGVVLKKKKEEHEAASKELEALWEQLKTWYVLLPNSCPCLQIASSVVMGLDAELSCVFALCESITLLTKQAQLHSHNLMADDAPTSLKKRIVDLEGQIARNEAKAKQQGKMAVCENGPCCLLLLFVL